MGLAMGGHSLAASPHPPAVGISLWRPFLEGGERREENNIIREVIFNNNKNTTMATTTTTTASLHRWTKLSAVGRPSSGSAV